MAALFHLEDYKEILISSLRQRKLIDPTFTHEKMASACRVQKTYLSKVLNHAGDLSSDQLYRAAKWLGLSDDEKRYLFYIYEYQKSEVIERKKELRESIERLKKKHSKTEHHIEGTTVTTKKTPTDLQDYYLNPDIQLVHIFLTIQKYCNDPSLIAKRIGISVNHLEKTLNTLERLGLILKKNGAVSVTQQDLHLSKTSGLYEPYRKLIRLKTLEKIQKGNDGKEYTFSVFFSADPKTREQIQERFFEFLKFTQKLVKSSKTTEVYQMNFDLLDWG
jgi:hypothetical protein